MRINLSVDYVPGDWFRLSSSLQIRIAPHREINSHRANPVLLQLVKHSSCSEAKHFVNKRSVKVPAFSLKLSRSQVAMAKTVPKCVALRWSGNVSECLLTKCLSFGMCDLLRAIKRIKRPLALYIQAGEVIKGFSALYGSLKS
jgi:hypothetical protein